MNIIAAMVALGLDADQATKHAALVAACRAHRDGTVGLPLETFARDLGTSRSTAWRARQRLGALGFLMPLKTAPGAPTIWRVPCSPVTTPTVFTGEHPTMFTGATDPVHSYEHQRRSTRERLEGGTPPTPDGEASPTTIKAALDTARAHLNGNGSHG